MHENVRNIGNKQGGGSGTEMFDAFSKVKYRKGFKTRLGGLKIPRKSSSSPKKSSSSVKNKRPDMKAKLARHRLCTLPAYKKQI